MNWDKNDWLTVSKKYTIIGRLIRWRTCVRNNNNYLCFISLLKSGLWEQRVHPDGYENVDYEEVYKIASEQSVVGLIAAGLEKSTPSVKGEHVFPFIGEALQLEQRNTAMNAFIEELIEKMRRVGIYTLLIKGQGIAQCYERPLWRACGDVDLFLSYENYEKAKSFLTPLVKILEDEDKKNLHLALKINQWIVELHGKLSCGVSKCADKGLDNVKDDIFNCGNVRSWMNGRTQVFLPGVDNDVIIVFTHILQHFFYGGIGLRQICDWCRLLWTYRESLNRGLLESRIRKAGLITEWKAFAAMAVDTLGMPLEAMPLYSSSKKWTRKGEKVIAVIMRTGNFGHNRDSSYYEKYPFVVYKLISFWRNTKDSINHLMIFPLDAARVWFKRLEKGIYVAAKGK